MRKPEITDLVIINAGKRLEAKNIEVGKTALREEAGGGNADRLLTVWLKHKEDNGTLERQIASLPHEAKDALRMAIDCISSGVHRAVVTAHAASQCMADRRAQDVEEASARRLRDAQEEIQAGRRRNE